MPFHLSLQAAVAMLLFAVVSVLIGAALAGAGGWRSMAERFPAPPQSPLDEERYRFTSIRTAGGLIGSASYESCVTVGLSPRGISLALWAPFRLFHPSLLIPWDAVEACSAVVLYRGHATQVTLRGGGRVRIYGRAAQAVVQRGTQRGLAEGAS
jgi:hypothetical protein